MRHAALLLAAGFMLLPAADAVAQRASEYARWEAFDRSMRLQRQRDRAQFEREMAEYQRRGDEQDRHLANLRQRLQQCGSCAERAALQAELDAIVAGRNEALRVYCSSFSALEALNPVAMNLLASMPSVQQRCGGVSADERRRAESEANRIYRRPLEEKARGGNPDDVVKLAGWYMKVEQDPDTACHIAAGPAAQGHGGAVSLFATRCLMQSKVAADRERGEQMLRECATRGAADCVTNVKLLDASRARDANEAARNTAEAAAPKAVPAAPAAPALSPALRQGCERRAAKLQAEAERAAGDPVALRRIEQARQRQREACSGG